MVYCDASLCLFVAPGWPEPAHVEFASAYDSNGHARSFETCPIDQMMSAIASRCDKLAANSLVFNELASTTLRLRVDESAPHPIAGLSHAAHLDHPASRTVVPLLAGCFARRTGLGARGETCIGKPRVFRIGRRKLRVLDLHRLERWAGHACLSVRA